MKALVLLSGGMDSTVTLAMAKQECNEVYTVSFDYGQRHRYELTQSDIIAKRMNVEKHYIIKVDVQQFIKSSLVSNTSDVTQSEKSIENTYVPARNIIFLSFGASLAESLGVDRIYLGVSGEDYQGQRPDTRKVFIDKYQELINVGLNCTVNEAKTLQLIAPFTNTSRRERIRQYLVRGFMEMLVFRVNNQFFNEIRKAQKAKDEIVSSKVKMRLIHEAFFTIFVLLVDMLNIIILIYAWSSKSLSVGSMVALFTLIENAYTPIAIFNVIYVQYKLDKASYTRFEQFLHAKDDTQLTDGMLINESIEDISIRNLSFQYEERQILNDICLSIRKGEKIAFVGESGSGKSTLVKIVVGLLKYNKGQVCLSGVSLNEICLNELYNRVTYLSQDAPIFDGTIKENVVFDKAVSDEKILEALMKVQLSYLLENVNNGLYTEIGEKGTCLSGGEKQRLALSRLWFDESELVILDEATSALDNLTEENVMREVILHLKEKTVIAIAHRLNSVISFDRIVVFRDGKIVDQGTFEYLISNNDYFLELYNSSVQQ